MSPPPQPGGRGPGPARPSPNTRPLGLLARARGWRLDLGSWQGEAKSGLQLGPAAGLLLGGLYTWRAMGNEEEGSLLYSAITFFVHEAGHMLFAPFGEFLTIAGGSLFQLIVPVAFAFSFWWRGMPLSAALVLYWLAFSLRSVAIYAWDAIDMTLPLGIVGVTGQEELAEHGETGHDWHNMLERLGLLDRTFLIAGAIRHLSTLTWAIATYLGLLASGVPLPAVLAWPAGRPQPRRVAPPPGSRGTRPLAARRGTGPLGGRPPAGGGDGPSPPGGQEA